MSTSILFKVTEEEHATYKALAMSRKMTLSKLIRYVLAKEINTGVKIPDSILDIARRLVMNKHRSHNA